MMERHPLASQAFIPLHKNPFLIVVARPGETVDPENLSAFITNGLQGVNYARGVWHFPLIGLNKEQDFLVVDRGGDGNNYDEQFFDKSETRILKM
jgi:ureidoglycolate lyase